jgi:hypothetical protein
MKHCLSSVLLELNKDTNATHGRHDNRITPHVLVKVQQLFEDWILFDGEFGSHFFDLKPIDMNVELQ